MSDNSGGEFFLGFVIGALAGAAAALLLAPASGEEIRHRIEEKGVEIKGQAQKAAEDARTQVQHLSEQARGQVEYAQEQGRIILADNVRKAQQAVQEAQAKVQKPSPSIE